MNFEDVVRKFLKNPCYIGTGSSKLALTWGVDKSIIKAARKEVRDRLNNVNNPVEIIEKETVEEISECITEEVPKGRLKSRWQNAGGKWLESYDYTEQDTIEGIDFDTILSKVLGGAPEFLNLTTITVDSDYALNVYLTDQHIGASVTDSLYSNQFDAEVFAERMQKVYEAISKLTELYSFRIVNVFYLGDTFDGQDGFTVKRTHLLPQNMSNGEAFETGLSVNKIFLENLILSRKAEEYNVYFVNESNHGGDMDLYLFKALKLWLNSCFNNFNVKAEISSSFLGVATCGEHTFIYTHGKDNKDMKNGLPLNLDAKTEIFLNQYIYEKNIKGNISVIKGDLHQDSSNNAKLFRYRNVPSLFGSSKWIMSNYGLTEPGVGYDIFKVNNKGVISGTILFTDEY
jgi:hypothetical protein